MDAQTQEERNVAEAIRLSLLDDATPPRRSKIKSENRDADPHHMSSKLQSRAGSSANEQSLSVADQLKARAERMKRERDAQDVHDSPPPPKRPAVESTYERNDAGPSRPSNFGSFAQTFGSSSASSSSGSSTAHTLKFPNGALRITRTPGRTHHKNCVSLDDIVSRNHLVSACLYSFYIAESEFFPHFPFSKTSNAIPIFVGRDANMDPELRTAVARAQLTIKGKISAKNLDPCRPILRSIYKQKYGKNYHAFHPYCPGSAHSKIMCLVYPTFLRIVITSCNFMDCDTVLGDNHWYIHDLKKRDKPSKSVPQGFEADFLSHLQALDVPDAFLDTIRGVYDYSTVKVSLVTSVPGTHSGDRAAQHGLLRLRKVVKALELKLPNKFADEELDIEICTASIGNLSAKWLDAFVDCALGRKKLELQEEPDVPRMKFVFPTPGDVKRCHEDSQMVAVNIGCHLRPWASADENLQKLFHHYRSLDDRRLFHQKLIMVMNTTSKNALPYYIYIGSANTSASAWGTLETDKKENKETSNMKTAKISNFECGVVIPGNLLLGLLEPGTSDWQAGVITFQRPALPYDLQKDKPWNDPRWVKGGSAGKGEYSEATGGFGQGGGLPDPTVWGMFG